MTKVINLLGGSGIGKSTTAAGLFYKMKLNGMNVELVREYVKQWAWDGIQVGEYDQVYLFGKQAKYESKLYGKVDYIITDSPLLLNPVYESFYSLNGTSVTEPSVKLFLKQAKDQGVEHINILLKRQKKYDPRGRYQTEAEAKEVDRFLERKLHDWGINYITIEVSDEERVEAIIKMITSVPFMSTSSLTNKS